MALEDKIGQNLAVKIFILREICVVTKYRCTPNKVQSKKKTNSSRTQRIVGYVSMQSLIAMQTRNTYQGSILS